MRLIGKRMYRCRACKKRFAASTMHGRSGDKWRRREVLLYGTALLVFAAFLLFLARERGGQGEG